MHSRATAITVYTVLTKSETGEDPKVPVNIGYSAYTRQMNPEALTVGNNQPQADGDASLIRWMLSLSAEERLAVLQGFVDSVEEATGQCE